MCSKRWLTNYATLISSFFRQSVRRRDRHGWYSQLSSQKQDTLTITVGYEMISPLKHLARKYVSSLGWRRANKLLFRGFLTIFYYRASGERLYK